MLTSQHLAQFPRQKHFELEVPTSVEATATRYAHDDREVNAALLRKYGVDLRSAELQGGLASPGTGGGGAGIWRNKMNRLSKQQLKAQQTGAARAEGHSEEVRSPISRDRDRAHRKGGKKNSQRFDDGMFR